MKIKVIVFAIAVLLGICTVFLAIGSFVSAEEMPFALEVAGQEGVNLIFGWENNDVIYFFLPSYADLDKVRIKLMTTNKVELEDAVLESGMSCVHLQLSQPYGVVYSVWGMERHKDVILLKSKGIASAHIETQSGNMSYLHSNKSNKERGSIRIFSETGVLSYHGEIASISCRGNASWTETDKKSYGVTLATSADLLHLGTAERWVLLANALDGTYIRNKIVHDAAKTLELKYTADSEWLDLYLNGEYAGLYLLSEKNEIHPERVNITRENSFLISGEMESRLSNQKLQYVSTDAKQAMRIHYPEVLDDANMEELKHRLQSVENAIRAEDSIDPVSGKTLEELIDLETFAKKYLIDEVFGNIDGGAFSQFYYFDGADTSGRLYAGPVWDYDLSMGADYMWQMRNPYALYANRPQIKQGNDCVWIHSLYQKEVFRDQVVALYQEIILPFLDDVFNERVFFYAEIIESAAYMDGIRWKLDDALQDEISKLYSYMDQRKQLLNSMWIDGHSYCVITLIQGGEYNNAYYLVSHGEYLQELPILEDSDMRSYIGWYYKDTNEPFDASKPITEDIEIYAKWVDKPSKKVDQIIKLIPLGVIGVLGGVLVVCDIRRPRKR